MVKNSGQKKAARAFLAKNPEMSYTEALRRTRRLKIGDEVKAHSRCEGRFSYGTVVAINELRDRITVRNKSGIEWELDRNDAEYMDPL